MSAYVVDPDTIDYLMAAAGRFSSTFYAPRAIPDLFTPDEALKLAQTPQLWSGNTFRIHGRQADLLGAILLAQNIASVNYRYAESAHIPQEPIAAYTYRSIPYSDIDPVVVLKSIACLRYQSCETDDYSETFAAYVLDVLEHDAIAHLKGYDKAPWGWTRITEEVSA